MATTVTLSERYCKILIKYDKVLFVLNESGQRLQFYSVFQGFSKAKSDNCGLNLSSGQFLILPHLPQKNKARFKSGQSWLKNNHLAT